MKPENMTKAQLLEEVDALVDRIGQIDRDRHTVEQTAKALDRRLQVVKDRETTNPTLLAIAGCLDAIADAGERAARPEADEDPHPRPGAARWWVDGAQVGWSYDPGQPTTPTTWRGVDVAQVIAYLQREYAHVLEPDPDATTPF